MLSGLTEVPYFRCIMARSTSVIVTGRVCWHRSFHEVRRFVGSGGHGWVLAVGKSAFHSTLPLPMKSDRPSRGGMGLWCVLWC